MAVSVLARLAARSAVPVFAATGGGGREVALSLRLRPELRFVRSPRHATLLLVAGEARSWLAESVRRVHDQLPHPRATVWWEAQGDTRDVVPEALVVRGDVDAVATAIRETHAAVITGAQRSEDDLLPDEPPAPWEGLGDHGQGGEGMMGGRPYGRPMPEMDHDPDGLMLDRLPLRLGPFLPGFPPGLALDLALQGDVVREAQVVDPPFGHPLGGDPGPFERARRETVPVAELERARAAHHLHRLSDLLVSAGLDALAVRTLRVAARPRIASVRRLTGLLRRTGALAGSTSGVGVIPADTLDRVGGPIARAAGLESDARTDDPSYRGLDFRPVTRPDGDARARWRLWLDEAEQALGLADRATDRTHDPRDALETPAGPADGAPIRDLLPQILPGMEIGDVVATVASLGMGLEPVRAAGDTR